MYLVVSAYIMWSAVINTTDSIANLHLYSELDANSSFPDEAFGLVVEAHGVEDIKQ
jgi:hypothetical protein